MYQNRTGHCPYQSFCSEPHNHIIIGHGLNLRFDRQQSGNLAVSDRSHYFGDIIGHKIFIRSIVVFMLPCSFDMRVS